MNEAEEQGANILKKPPQSQPNVGTGTTGDGSFVPSNVVGAELKWRSELLWMTEPCTRRMETEARARLRKQLAEIERGLRQSVDAPWNKADPRVNAAAGEMFWHLAFILKEQERTTLLLKILASEAGNVEWASRYGPADLIGVDQFGLSKLGRTLPASWLSERYRDSGRAIRASIGATKEVW